jgi:Lon protease-like protein
MNSKDLPQKIAIFPLSYAIVFPQTILPLNIFEDRYIQLIDDCMKDKKLFGMVQPKINKGLKPEVYSVGCLGKITSFNETKDKRFLITLSGIIRFRIKEESNSMKMYREFKVDYSDFIDDLNALKMDDQQFDIKNLLNKVKLFLEKKNYSIKIDELKKLNIDQLISTISMISPFSIEEKQKLIETIETKHRFKILEEIINFNLLDIYKYKTIQ